MCLKQKLATSPFKNFLKYVELPPLMDFKCINFIQPYHKIDYNDCSWYSIFQSLNHMTPAVNVH